MRIWLKLNKQLLLYILLTVIIVRIAFPSINSFNLLNRKTDVNIKTSETIEHLNELRFYITDTKKGNSENSNLIFFYIKINDINNIKT